MNILTLFSRYGTTQYVDSDIYLRNQMAALLPNTTHDVLVVDTSLPASVDIIDERGVHVIGADNNSWEFGGWNAALQFIAKSIYDYDYVHLATSACFNGYIEFHKFLSEPMLEAFKDKAAALGHIEVYNEPVYYAGTKFQAWLRSSYILLPMSELLLLNDLVGVRDTCSIFSDDPTMPFLNTAPLCEQYIAYIHSWLTGEGTGQGVVWHSKFDLDADTMYYYKSKATAILNEMSLSNRLIAQGCRLVDMTWLHRKMSCGSPIDVIPSWHTQISERGTGHEFIVEG